MKKRDHDDNPSPSARSGSKAPVPGNQGAGATIPKGLDLTQDGLRLVSLTFDVTLYTGTVFSQIPKAILKCFERLLALCPKEHLRFYATANMRMHKPVTSRTFGMLQTWLKPGAPPMEYMDLELKDGETYQDASKFKFAICDAEKGSVRYEAENANLLSMAFPPEWGLLRTDEMFRFVRELCSIFPFQSAHAGFSFECSRYDKEESETFAWRKSMQHPGIDIVRIPFDAKAVGHDALKGVNWLTILGKPLLQRLTGLDRLRASRDGVEVIDVPGGVIIRAGPAPAFGDTRRNDRLPLYQEVYRVVGPLIEIAAERSMAFNLVDDFVENTEAWYRRFADE